MKYEKAIHYEDMVGKGSLAMKAKRKCLVTAEACKEAEGIGH